MTKFSNTDLERAILSICLIEDAAIDKVLLHVDREAFVDPVCRLIWGTIEDMVGESKKVDVLTVADYMNNKGTLAAIGGPYELSVISSEAVGSTHIEAWSETLAGLKTGRQVQELGMHITKKAMDSNDPYELLGFAEKGIQRVQEGSFRGGSSVMDGAQLGAGMIEAYRIAKDRMLSDGFTGIRTPVKELTQLTSGWQDEELIILAARPGMGKTALAMSIASCCIDDGEPVAVFSLEMAAVRLAFRLMSVRTGIATNNFMQGYGSAMDEQAMMQTVDFLTKNSHLVHIDDTPGVTIDQLRARSRMLKSKFDIKMIIVDYLQLMSGTNKKGRNREQEISEISRGLKMIAKELKVPVIALSQLSRSVETRGGDKRPQLSDLRESGAIEQDADMVIFQYRGEYYQILEDDDGNSLVGVGELIIAKNRNGALTTIKCHFDSTTTAWKDLDSKDDDYTNPSITSDMMRRKDMGWVDTNEDIPF